MPPRKNQPMTGESFPELYDFIGDPDKMLDFCELSKEEFLASYSYLTEAEYRLTKLRVLELCHEATLNG